MWDLCKENFSKLCSRELALFYLFQFAVSLKVLQIMEEDSFALILSPLLFLNFVRICSFVYVKDMDFLNYISVLNTLYFSSYLVKVKDN